MIRLPITIGVNLGAQGYASCRIDKVLPPTDMGKTHRVADAQQLTQIAGQAKFNACYETLKACSEVKINGSAVDSSRPANTAED